jgi:hypothetical protein
LQGGISVSVGAKVKAVVQSVLRRIVLGRTGASRRLRIVVVGAVGAWLLLASMASAGAGTGGAEVRAQSSAGRVHGTTAAAQLPLPLRQISLRELRGRIVGTAIIVNTRDTPVRATTGVLGLSRGAGDRATSALTFSVPALAPRSSTKLRFTTPLVRALRVAPGTYGVLLCEDVYSQVRRFARITNCWGGAGLAISTMRLLTRSGLAPNTVIKTGPANASRSSNATFGFASTSGRSDFECSLDRGPWLGCTSTQGYTALVDGPHSLDVRAVSREGKADPTPAHATWTVDTVRPAVALVRPVSGSTTNDNRPAFSGLAGTAPGDSSTITVKVFSGSAISDLPVQTRTATVSGGSWSVAPTQPLADGIYTARAEQSDSAGNTGLSAPSTFTVNTTSPAPVNVPAGGSTAPRSYSIGGTVSGLSGTVVLQDNGGDDLSVNRDGSFTFSKMLADGAGYNVTVKSNPSGQICTALGAAGTVASLNVTTVAVTCASSTTESTSAKDDFNRPDGGLGADWAATTDGGLSIASQAVLGIAGALAGDVRVGGYGSDQFSQIDVTSATLPVAGWVGPTVRSQNGGQDTYLGLYWNDQNSGHYELLLYLRKAGAWIQLGSTYTLGGPLPAGTHLSLSAVGPKISFQQDGIERIAATDSTLTGGAPGLMTYGAATADNWVGSAPSAYSIGGTVSGALGTVVLQDNGGDDLSVSGDEPFTFSTSLADSAGYQVTVKSSPKAQTCTASGGSGTVASANVTTVAILCTTSTTNSPLQVQSRSTDANGVVSYNITSSDNGSGAQIVRVLAPTNPAPGVPHNFLYVLPVEPELGTTYGDGLDTLRSMDAQDKFNVTIIEPSFAIDPWYANNPNDPSLQYETFITRDLVPWVTQNFAVPAASQPLGALAGNEQNWLIGFSKSGIGGQDLLLKHPDIFSLAASWDFPADMSAYDQFGSSSANEYGSNANFQTNYRLTPSFIDSHKTPFMSRNRIWIGGYNAFQTDVTNYDSLLTSAGIPHTTETPQQMSHGWGGDWMALALNALSEDSAALAGTP